MQHNASRVALACNQLHVLQVQEDTTRVNGRVVGKEGLLLSYLEYVASLHRELKEGGAPVLLDPSGDAQLCHLAQLVLAGDDLCLEEGQRPLHLHEDGAEGVGDWHSHCLTGKGQQ